MQPDEDELEEIPEHHAELLRSKNWAKVTDPDVTEAFGCLVKNHYASHLRALGIQTVIGDNKVTASAFDLSEHRLIHGHFRFL